MGKNRQRSADPFFGRRTLSPLVGGLWEAHDRAVAPFGITARQGAMLLSCSLGEVETAAELARLYAVELSSTTRMLERLERKGLVRRQRSAEDRRKVLIRITPAGDKLLRQALPKAAAVARSAWVGVTAAERAVLQRVAAKVLRNLGTEPGRTEK